MGLCESILPLNVPLLSTSVIYFSVCMYLVYRLQASVDPQHVPGANNRCQLWYCVGLEHFSYIHIYVCVCVCVHTEYQRQKFGRICISVLLTIASRPVGESLSN